MHQLKRDVSDPDIAEQIEWADFKLTTAKMGSQSSMIVAAAEVAKM